MLNPKTQKNLLIGAAFAAGILGTLTSLLRNNKVNSTPRKNGELLNKRMLLGGMAGGVVAAATALLLAPKSGIELMKDIYSPFSRFVKDGRIASLIKTKKQVHKKAKAATAVKKKSIAHNGAAVLAKAKKVRVKAPAKRVKTPAKHPQKSE